MRSNETNNKTRILAQRKLFLQICNFKNLLTTCMKKRAQEVNHSFSVKQIFPLFQSIISSTIFTVGLTVILHE